VVLSRQVVESSSEEGVLPKVESDVVVDAEELLEEAMDAVSPSLFSMIRFLRLHSRI